MAYQSAKGSGGTSGAHTNKLRVLVSPASSYPGSSGVHDLVDGS